ncbi:MAG: protein kinase [Deltaproteobacteria bacterium]|jgi:serine/threonine-protein kinase|nr:protein kinase [Deltaproteobacteria bacterium]MBW2533806.1 protein kinase [Deltaproteobacteria bacterium]
MGRSESRPRPSVPDRIGPYEVLLPIGSGGMGTVYLARRHGIGGFRREVALKVMHAHLRDAKSFSAALIEEAKIAGRIRHPNVVPVLDVGMDTPGVYLVMDYVEGDSLSGLHRVAKATGRVVPIGIALRVLVDALAGLHAAHELRDERGQSLGLIHRDFSPQNLLVGIDGMTRLTDFGVAKARTNLEQTNVGLIKGKLRYMSPEQVRCDPIDRRSDVWAAGVVAWEILTGRRLYASKHEAAAMLQLVSKPPPAVRSIRADVPEEIEKVVSSALQIEPQERCATAKLFSDRISAAAREVDWLASRDEVAEFVSTVSGTVLATRRQQVSEVRRLREEITAIRSHAAGSEASTTTGEDSSLEPEDESTVRVAAEEAVAEDGTDTETTRRYVAPARGTTPSAIPRDETTDVQAVTDALRIPAHRVGRLIPSLIVVVALMGGFAVVRECTRSPETASSAAVAPGAPSEPGAAARTDGQPTTDESEARSANETLTIRADLPVARLRIGDRKFTFDAPTRELAIPLSAAEHGRKLRLHAVSADGRETTAELTAGTTQVDLLFPQRATPAVRPPKNPTPAPPPAAPLATNPYLRKKR